MTPPIHLLYVLNNKVRLACDVFASGRDSNTNKVPHSNVQAAVRFVGFLGQVEVEAILLSESEQDSVKQYAQPSEGGYKGIGWDKVMYRRWDRMEQII